MLSTTESNKILCHSCSKAQGIYRCKGCCKFFCPHHSIDHRSALIEQLEQIEIEHCFIYQTFTEKHEDSQRALLVEKINQWETEAISTIQRVANEIKNKLCNESTENNYKIKEKFEQLSDQLKKAREENDFSEIDLRRWSKDLNKLKQELVKPLSLKIRESSTALVNMICIDRQMILDSFDRVYGNAILEDNDRTVIKTISSGHTDIGGKQKYIAGQYIVRFKVEHLSGNPWIFFGIISRSEKVDINSYKSSSSYGWATGNQIYIGGKYQSESSCDVIQNDVVTLLIDCDQQQIELKNERTKHVMKMPIDINCCPLPWLFHINIYEINTRVRILSPIGQ